MLPPWDGPLYFSLNVVQHLLAVALLVSRLALVAGH